MRQFWKRAGRDGFDERIRAARPEARPEFLALLAERTRDEHSIRSAPLLVRFGFSAGLVAVLAGALALVGGFDYAASGAAQTIDAVQTAVSSGSTTAQSSPGNAQYHGARCGQEPPKKPPDPEKRERCPIQAGKDKTSAARGPATLSIPVAIVDYAPDTPVTLYYITRDGTAKAGSDYVRTYGRLTFAPDETLKSVNVSVYKNKKNEGTEELYLRLYDPSANAFIETEPGVGTITND